MWHIVVPFVVVLGSLLLANLIAGLLDVQRSRRIERKLRSLGAAATSGQIDAAVQIGAKVVPITIITGFLGSGKTVLLNRLLSDACDRRICVIENEAGAVSIDHALLRVGAEPGAPTAALADVVLLQNGCMCCSATGSGDELERVLDRLLQLNPHFAERRIDHIVIECSGLVDPAPIIASLMRPGICSRFELDSVVAVVDAKHVGHQLDDRGLFNRHIEAGKQVAYADVVLLNKTDVATAAEVRAAEAAIREINPTARLLRCAFARLQPSAADALFGVGGYDASRVRALLQAESASGAACQGGAHCHIDHQHGSPRKGAHRPGVSALTIDLEHAVVEHAALRDWLVALVSCSAKDIYRIKGLVRVRLPGASASTAGAGRDGDGGVQEEGLCVVHGVHGDLHAAVVEAGAPSTPSSPSLLTPPPLHHALVIIGHALDKAAIYASFQAAVPRLSAPTRAGRRPGAGSPRAVAPCAGTGEVISSSSSADPAARQLAAKRRVASPSPGKLRPAAAQERAARK